MFSLLSLNRSTRKSGVARVAASAFGLAAVFNIVSQTAYSHPLLPGSTIFLPALIGQAGTEADAEAALKAGDAAKAVAIYSELIKAKPNLFKLYNSRGTAYFKTGEFDKAAADYTIYITKRPLIPEGYINRAYAYKELGKADEGLADLAKAETLDKLPVEQQRLRGELYLLKKDYPQAIAAFTVVGAQPGEAGSLGFLLIGDAYNAQGDTANAVLNYGKGIAAAPKNPYGYGVRGQLYITDKKYDLAIKDLTQYITLAPNEGFVYYYRGLAYASQKTPESYTAAKADLTKFLTIEKNPNSLLEGTKVLASVQKESGDTKGAIESYGKIIKADPKNDDALFQRGMVYMSQNDYPNATKDFETYATTFPTGKNAGNAAYNLGSAFLATKDWEKAVPAFTSSLKSDPTDVASFYGRLVANFNLKQFDKVVADGDKVFASVKPDAKPDPQVTDTYRLQALAYSELATAKGDKALGAKAIETIKKYVTLNPKDTNGPKLEADIVTAHGNSDDLIATMTAQIAKTTDPAELARLYRNRGAGYVEKKDLDKAILDFTKVTTLTPKDSKAFVMLAEQQSQKGDIDGAIASYTSAIPLSPEDPTLIAIRADRYVAKQDPVSFAKADADFTEYEAKAGAKVAPTIYYTHAQLKRTLKKSDEAIALYQKYLAVETDPEKVATSTKELASVYLLLKQDYPNAIKVYTDYLAKKPKDSAVLINRAAAYRLSSAKGDPDKALDKAMADANSALVIEPTNKLALTERAFINLKIADLYPDDPVKAAAAWKEAIADCDKAIAADPKFALAYYCKGFAAYSNSTELGDADPTYVDKAVDAFTKFVAIAPPTDPNLKRVNEALKEIKDKKAG